MKKLISCLVMASLPLAATAERLPFITKQGPHYIDESGNRVILRGVNLGNWLIQEMWMQGLNDGSIPDQHSLEELLASRFGESEKDRLMELWRENIITERDFDLLQEFGFNVIRLPFWHTLMEEDDAPFVLKEGAFDWLDQAIAWAAERQIHVILDMHGAQGGQGWEHHTGWEGRNELWSSQENQDRVVWLWKQIADRYKNNSTVVAYDILNEPWGTNSAQLEAVSLRIAEGIREVDPTHIIYLPADLSGLWFYDEPVSNYGLDNIAFTHHFYPGLFGGQPTIEEQQNHFNNTGPEYIGHQLRLDSPFLVGEMNVVNNSAGGAEMMRHHYDYYAAQGWATTAWSWKVFTDNGGIGQGSWGMVTNPLSGALVRGDTWNCDDWDSTFANACQQAREFTVPEGGAGTWYLVIKAGSCCGGALDVSIDSISLTSSGGTDVVVNGDFNGASGWSHFNINGTVNKSFSETIEVPAGASGTALRMTSPGDSNGGIYQAVQLNEGETYTLDGVFRDVNSGANAAWCEFYLGREEPVAGVDYLIEDGFGDIDYHTASMAEIEDFFTSLSTMDLLINQANADWLGEEDRTPNLIPGWPPVWRIPQATDELPISWRGFDVGGANRGGQRVYSNTRMSIYGAGEDIWNSSDQFRYVYQPVEDTFDLRARVTDLRDTGQFAKGGLMFRVGLAGDAANLTITMLPSGVIESNKRVSNGAATTSTSASPSAVLTPTWLRIAGDGSGIVRSYYSSDGGSWTELSALDANSLTGAMYAGLVALSHDDSLFTKVDFESISLSGAKVELPLEEMVGWYNWYDQIPAITNREFSRLNGNGNAIEITTKPNAIGGSYLPMTLTGGLTYKLQGDFELSNSGLLQVWQTTDVPEVNTPVVGELLVEESAATNSGIMDVEFTPAGIGQQNVSLLILLSSDTTSNSSAVIDQLTITPVVPEGGLEGWQLY